MAKVRAAYSYSYNYEGKEISFKKDEEFQLLVKSNKNWWQVRRWMDGSAQDIYVPAVYIKEVEATGPAVVKDEKDPTSTKPRSKTNALDTLDTPSDAGPGKLVRQISGGGVQGSKGKVPPPVQIKPKPQKMPVARPVSSMDMEGGEAKGPIISEFSNLLLKKKPHLAGESKPLTKSSSSDNSKSLTEEKVRTVKDWGGLIGCSSQSSIY